MIKNIPNYLSRNDMLEFLNKFDGQFDLFYMPMTPNNKKNMGFAIVNMIHPFFILDIYLEYQLKKWKYYLKQLDRKKHDAI